MIKTFATTAIALMFVVGCNDAGAPGPVDSRYDTVALDVNQLPVSPQVRQVLISLQSLVDRYNLARSKYGERKGRLSHEDASGVAEDAGVVLTAINDLFEEPVFMPIGEEWSQVPSQLTLLMPSDPSIRDQTPPCFTLSHFYDGHHEYDFVINDEGKAKVVRSRYDCLGLPW